MTLGPLFLTEDKALRDLLKNMVVTDQKGNSEALTRPVGVWFGMPVVGLGRPQPVVQIGDWNIFVVPEEKTIGGGK